MTPLDTALALAALKPPLFVGPALRAGKTKRPLGRDGFYGFSTDPNIIRAAFTAYPMANHVAVWTGPSGILIEDIDTGAENGYNTLIHMGADWESIVHYPTPSGGEHHIFAAPDPTPGPAAPIFGYPGIDRRSGDSCALWYGPVPTQEEWTAMRLQKTPSWLLGGGGRTTPRASKVSTASADDAVAWIDSLTPGPAIPSFITDTGHYGECLKAIVRLVEHTRRFPSWVGTAETFDLLAEGYVYSPVSSTPQEERQAKVFGMIRWALGATEGTEDMSAYLARHAAN